ncbi:MAG: phage portal protein [Pseudomonadota bacterium]
MAFDWLRAGRGAPLEEKASAVGGFGTGQGAGAGGTTIGFGHVMAFQGPGRAVWSPTDTATLAQNGYGGNVVGFRAVRMVSEAAAAIPLVLTEDGARMASHPLLTLLERPNPGANGRGLMEAVFGHLILSGNAYLEGVPSELGEYPVELHVLRPDRMQVVPGPDGWPAAYDYRVGRQVHRFEQAEEWHSVLHLKAFHPLDDHYGMSPMAPASASLDVHNAASKWAKALLDNAARPSGAIVFGAKDGSSLSEEQFRRLRHELEDNHQGVRNAGRPMLLEGGLDWKPMSHSPKDMDFLETKHAAAREIALAVGVPPMLLGLPGDNTYSNYQEANRAFYRLTVLPLVRKVAAGIAGWLGRNAGAEITLEPDLDQVPALADEREALWRRVGDADFLSDEEKRLLLGLGPRETVMVTDVEQGDG